MMPQAAPLMMPQAAPLMMPQAAPWGRDVAPGAMPPVQHGNVRGVSPAPTASSNANAGVSPAVPGHLDTAPTGRLPIRMLHDRVLVSTDHEAGERRSSAGIVIPATAAVGKRLAWATVVAAGPSVRQVQIDDRVLYDPEDRAEVELQSTQYILLRERDIHAVAAPRVEDGRTGLYL